MVFSKPGPAVYPRVRRRGGSQPGPHGRALSSRVSAINTRRAHSPWLGDPLNARGLSLCGQLWVLFLPHGALPTHTPAPRLLCHLRTHGGAVPVAPELSWGAAVGLRGTVETFLCIPGVTLLSAVPAMSSPPAYPGIRISGCWALGAEGR